VVQFLSLLVDWHRGEVYVTNRDVFEPVAIGVLIIHAKQFIQARKAVKAVDSNQRVPLLGHLLLGASARQHSLFSIAGLGVDHQNDLLVRVDSLPQVLILFLLADALQSLLHAVIRATESTP